MPEYLAPGVFVEERPASLRAIEGVSTSTAAFVGPAERGPVAGADLPFTPENGFTLHADPAPVLVTSYSAFVRAFGQPLRFPTPTDSEDRGYLGHAARVFFENGGRRLYVSRAAALNAKDATHTMGQGVVARLSRRVKAGDDVLALNSLRGIDQGTTLQVRRIADASNPLEVPATPATLTGGSGPFSLDDQDQLTIAPLDLNNAPVGQSATVQVNAHLAVLRSVPANLSGEIPNLSTGDTLEIQVNGGPTVLIAFMSGTIDDAVFALAEQLPGTLVSKIVDGNNDERIQITSEIAGTAADLTVVGGSGSVALGFGPFGALPSASNVADVSAVSVTEIVTLFNAVLNPVNHKFTVAAEAGSGNLQFSTTDAGDVTFDTPTGTMAITLGLGAPSPGGAAQAEPDPVVSSYDTRQGQITIGLALTVDLDPTQVYLVVAGSAPTPAVGPKFHARNAGAWGNDLRVAVRPADRAPVDVTAVATAGSTAIQVRATTSLYIGAILEVDDGVAHSTHEVMDIAGTTVTLQPALPSALPVGGLVRVLEIDVLISDVTGASPDEVFRGLSWNPRQQESILRRHYASQINERSQLVFAQPPGVDGLAGFEGGSLASQPTNIDGGWASLTGGGNDVPSTSEIDDAIVGDDLGPGQRTGLQAFADIPDINLVAAPGHTSQAVQLALIAHAEQLRYRFAILDGQSDPTGTVNEVSAHRSLYDTSHAAYYAPWIQMSVDGVRRHLPPSAFMAGIYARVDNERGVWKAPANEVVRNALGLQTSFTTGEQEVLNPTGVNLVRRFEPGGIRVWGARTVSSDPSLKYVNVRRTLLFLEASIERSTQWVVFEPNTPQTWARVTQSVRAFLLTQWREGALFGRSESQAFFVRCDESTMTADDVLNGRLICRIGVAVVRPAEFVIFRIEQLTGFAQT